MNIADLKYFVTCADIKNISHAAVELGITQPSLSLAIKRLEENLESTLLLRTKKGVSLTNEGKILYKRAHEILNLWDEAQSDVLNIKFDLSGTIRFGVHPSVGLYTLKYFVPSFLSDNPKINIDMEHGLSRDMLSKIIHSELDIALVINPIDHPDIIKLKILNDEVCLWTSDSAKKQVDMNTLICDPSLIQSKDIIKKMKKLKINPSRVLYSSSLENIASLVDSGAGIGVLPTRVVKESNANLIKIKNTPIFKDELYLVYRYENKNLQYIKEFIKAMKDSLS